MEIALRKAPSFVIVPKLLGCEEWDKHRAKLASDVEKFLAAGNEITEIPAGQGAEWQNRKGGEAKKETAQVWNREKVKTADAHEITLKPPEELNETQAKIWQRNWASGHTI